MSAAGAFPGFLNGARPKSRMPRAGIWFLGKGNNPIPTSKRVWGAEIRPPATPKPLNRSSPKITRVIRSRISTNKQNLVTIPQEVSFPRMRKIAHQNVYSASFLGSSNNLQPRPLNRFSRVIRQMTRFRARMCLFGVRKQK